MWSNCTGRAGGITDLFAAVNQDRRLEVLATGTLWPNARSGSRTSNFVTTTIIFALTAVPTVIGQVQENSSKPVHYFVRNLGTLGGVLGSSAHSINDQGWVAGVANLAGDTEEHAALWQDGVVTDLGTLGGDNSNVDFPVKNDDGLSESAEGFS